METSQKIEYPKLKPEEKLIGISSEDLKKLLDLREQGYSYNELKRVFNKSYFFVRYWCTKVLQPDIFEAEAKKRKECTRKHYFREYKGSKLLRENKKRHKKHKIEVNAKDFYKYESKKQIAWLNNNPEKKEHNKEMALKRWRRLYKK